MLSSGSILSKQFLWSAVCKSWKALGEDLCFTQKVVDGDGTIMAAVHRAQPGDTISIPAGYYEVIVHLWLLFCGDDRLLP